MIDDRELRKHLLYLLRGGGAHIDFESLVAGFPINKINAKVHGIPYTPWQVLEHMRITQWDIVRFSRDSSHVSPDFPNGYWPPHDFLADAKAWNETVRTFNSDLKEMEDMVEDESTDLFAQIPHGDGQTILREALLIADHNAYHLGALALMKRLLSSEDR